MKYHLFSHSPQAPCFNGVNLYHAATNKEKELVKSLIGKTMIVKLKEGNSYSYWEGKPIEVKTLHKDDVPREHYSWSTTQRRDIPCKHQIILESPLVQIETNINTTTKFW